MEFHACEFFVEPNSEAIYVKRTPCTKSSIVLSYANNTFTCATSYDYIDYFNIEDNKYNFNGKSLADLMLKVIESDRYVKATPNNSVSSRSHVMIILKFKSTDPQTLLTPTLIIGDFAGVENTFMCDDLITLGSFGVIRDKNAPEKDFYNENRIIDISPEKKEKKSVYCVQDENTLEQKHSGGQNLYFPTLSSNPPIENYNEIKTIFTDTQYRAIERCIFDCLDMKQVKKLIQKTLFEAQDLEELKKLFEDAKHRLTKMMIFDLCLD